MASRFGNKIIITGALFAAVIAGCASVPKTTTAIHPLIPSSNMTAVAGIRSWVERQSLEAQSLSATGDITVEQNGESNSASFSMKSKRLGRLVEMSSFDSHRPSQIGAERVDSLSIEISGPFGIKVARFMASPRKYEFYDILHDQTLEGKTDQQSLAELTHLNGISLQDMSDLIYGLVRIDSNREDSVELYSDNANHFVLVVSEPGIYTSAYDFEGSLPNDSLAGNLSLVHYRRWQGTSNYRKDPPALSLQFMEPGLINGISIPQRIEVEAGGNKLTLQYNHIELNPAALIVKIKMPSE